MKFASIGTPAASRLRRDGRKGQAGFTLFEALVALALALKFAAVLGPHLSQARRIMPKAAWRRKFCCARCSMRHSIVADWLTLRGRAKRANCDGASSPSRRSPRRPATRISRDGCRIA